MEKDQYGHNVNSEGVEIKASTSSSGNAKIDFYGSCPAEDPDHDSIHIIYNEDTGEGTIVDATGDKTETTDVKCFLTTACMRHMRENFDDNCYELNTLRWFRDNFVSKEDKETYYEKAPIIVENINKQDNNNEIYKDIYDNVIALCVKAIECGNYDFAYQTYKKCILDLEDSYVNVKKKVLCYR